MKFAAEQFEQVREIEDVVEVEVAELDLREDMSYCPRLFPIST